MICGCGVDPKSSAPDEEETSSMQGSLIFDDKSHGFLEAAPQPNPVTSAGSWRKPGKKNHSTNIEVGWVPRPRQENRRLRVENAELKKRLYFAGPYVGDLGAALVWWHNYCTRIQFQLEVTGDCSCGTVTNCLLSGKILGDYIRICVAQYVWY